MTKEHIFISVQGPLLMLFSECHLFQSIRSHNYLDSFLNHETFPSKVAMMKSMITRNDAKLDGGDIRT